MKKENMPILSGVQLTPHSISPYQITLEHTFSFDSAESIIATKVTCKQRVTVQCYVTIRLFLTST
jgi:hypothetical protein